MTDTYRQKSVEAHEQEHLDAHARMAKDILDLQLRVKALERRLSFAKEMRDKLTDLLTGHLDQENQDGRESTGDTGEVRTGPTPQG